jgi:hypothetical protein
MDPWTSRPSNQQFKVKKFKFYVITLNIFPNVWNITISETPLLNSFKHG